MEKQLMPSRPQPVASLSPISTAFTDEETANASVNSFFTVLGRWKWRILAFVFLSVAATAGAVLRMRPLFEATAKIEIDHPTAAMTTALTIWTATVARPVRGGAGSCHRSRSSIRRWRNATSPEAL